MSATIICPKCKSPLSIDEALRAQIETDIKSDLQGQSQKYLEAEKERLRKQMLDWQEEEKKKLDQQSADIEKKIRVDLDEESRLLRKELGENQKKLEEAREFELKLRQEKIELEKAKQEMELQKMREMDVERDKIRQETANILLEQHRMKDAEKDKQMSDLRKRLEELQLKANLASQQLQGEVLELQLEELLKVEFPQDDILPVPKGVNGADILQRVRNSVGSDCGVIVWESKQTKAWSQSWVQKLKDDQRAAKADMAILVSSVLPDGIKNFGPKDGIYVTSYDCFIALAKFVRLSLIQLSVAKNTAIGKNEKMEMIYNYLSGSEFRGRVEAIVEAFSAMKKDLDDEKKAFIKIWAKREKEIERVINNTVGMHGDLQGLMGSSLPEIAMLEVSELGDEPDNLL